MNDPNNGDIIQPKNNPTPPQQVQQRFDDPTTGYQGNVPVRKGGNGTWQIVIGVIMLVAGIGLSLSGIGRVFIGLIVVGIINLIRGLANAAKS
jgi:hypothetical protein